MMRHRIDWLQYDHDQHRFKGSLDNVMAILFFAAIVGVIVGGSIFFAGYLLGLLGLAPGLLFGALYGAASLHEYDSLNRPQKYVMKLYRELDPMGRKEIPITVEYVKSLDEDRRASLIRQLEKLQTKERYAKRAQSQRDPRHMLVDEQISSYQNELDARISVEKDLS